MTSILISAQESYILNVKLQRKHCLIDKKDFNRTKKEFQA